MFQCAFEHCNMYIKSKTPRKNPCIVTRLYFYNVFNCQKKGKQKYWMWCLFREMKNNFLMLSKLAIYSSRPGQTLTYMYTPNSMNGPFTNNKINFYIRTYTSMSMSLMVCSRPKVAVLLAKYHPPTSNV